MDEENSKPLNSYFVSVFPGNNKNLFAERGRTDIFRKTYKLNIDERFEIYFK